MVDTHGNVCYLQKELPKTAGAARHKDETACRGVKNFLLEGFMNLSVRSIERFLFFRNSCGGTQTIKEVHHSWQK